MRPTFHHVDDLIKTILELSLGSSSILVQRMMMMTIVILLRTMHDFLILAGSGN